MELEARLVSHLAAISANIPAKAASRVKAADT